MADLLRQAVDWLNGMREAHLSSQIVYQRGEQSVELAATPGGTGVEVTDDAGATVWTRQTDFIIAADTLMLGGEQVTPRVGDRIRMAVGASSEKVLIFEVLALAGGEHFRPADPMGRTLRIHAKQVDEE